MASIKKNIELPDKIVKILERAAKNDMRKIKPYMEKVLIDHANALVGNPSKSNESVQ